MAVYIVSDVDFIDEKDKRLTEKKIADIIELTENKENYDYESIDTCRWFQICQRGDYNSAK